MYVKNIFSGFFLAFGSLFGAIAQNTIRGRIIDQQAMPMEYVNVVVLNPSDSTLLEGYVTRSDGEFNFEGKHIGNLLKISTIGYATEYVKIGKADLGDILMHQSANTLGEVVLKGSRPQFQMGSNGLSVNVKGTILSEAGTAIDVIEALPGVDGINGSFSVIGKGKPLVYVNGRQVRNMAELGRLSSKDVARVELDNNPGARYSATVGAVIHIQTVKKKGDGLSGSARLLARQGNYMSENEQVNLNYVSARIELFGELSHGFSHSYQKQKEDIQTRTTADRWQQLLAQVISNRRNYVSGMLGMNARIAADHSLGIRYDICNNYLGHRSAWLTDESAYSNGTLVEQTMYDSKVFNSMPFSHLVNAYYSGKAGKVSIDFNTDIYFKGGRNRQDIEARGSDGTTQTVNSRSRQSGDMWASKLVLSCPLPKGKIEWGCEYTQTSYSSVYSSRQQITPSTDDEIREKNISVFVSYGIGIGQSARANAGLRCEHAVSDYYSFGNYTEEQSRKYDRLFPYANVVFPIGKAKITLAYSEKTTRPSYSQLSSSVQYDSKYIYESGNPLLRPMIRHDISLSGVYEWVYVSLSYDHASDYFSTEYVPYEEGSPINMGRRVNIDNVDYLSGSVSMSPKIGRWSPTWTVSIYCQDIVVKTYEGTRKLTEPLIQPKWTNYVDLGRNYVFYAAVSGHTSGDSNKDHFRESWQASLGLTKNVGGWNLQLRANDIFRTARNSLSIYGYSCLIDKWNYSDSQYLQFTATYCFNSTKSKYIGTGAGNSEKNRL